MGDALWLRRGRQRSAVVRVLRKPLTTSEICAAARQFAPCLRLRDIWFVLGELSKRKLVHCLNPQQVNGKLHCLTERGRRLVYGMFGTFVPAHPIDVPWKEYSLVVRARTRRLVLLELARPCYEQIPATAAALKKRLRQTCPIGLNPLLRTLKDLVRLKAVSVTGTIGNRRIYRLTSAGLAIIRELQRSS